MAILAVCEHGRDAPATAGETPTLPPALSNLPVVCGSHDAPSQKQGFSLLPFAFCILTFDLLLQLLRPRPIFQAATYPFD